MLERVAFNDNVGQLGLDADCIDANDGNGHGKYLRVNAGVEEDDDATNSSPLRRRQGSRGQAPTTAVGFKKVVRMAVLSAACMCALLLLAPGVDGREIRLRGEKIMRLEAGEPYRDAAVCNSYVSPNGPDSNVNTVSLQNCAYYKGTTTSPNMEGLPTNCDTDPEGTGKCARKATTAVCGTKKAKGSDGKCRFSSCDGTYAGNRAPCNLNGQCMGPKGCQEYLLKPRGGSVRVDGKAPKLAFQYNVGTYQIRYGTKGVDTCIWETRTCKEIGDTFKVECTNYQGDNSNLGVPEDPCIRLLVIADTSPPQVAPAFNKHQKPETYNAQTDSSDCNPPTDSAKEDVGCYDPIGLLGPYAPGYKVNLLDFWGGVKPEDKADCCGPNKDKPFYDVEQDERKRSVILHEGATEFQDPGVKIFDAVDGEMVYDENNFCKRIDNPNAGQPGELECKVVGDPGKVCKVIAGGQRGKCTDELNFDPDKTGKQSILYYAMDASDNLGFVRRTVCFGSCVNTVTDAPTAAPTATPATDAPTAAPTATPTATGGGGTMTKIEREAAMKATFADISELLEQCKGNHTGGGGGGGGSDAEDGSMYCRDAKPKLDSIKGECENESQEAVDSCAAYDAAVADYEQVMAAFNKDEANISGAVQVAMYTIVNAFAFSFALVAV